MDKFKMFIFILGIIFLGFLVLINSASGLARMLFMGAVYFFRKPLRSAIRLATKRDLFLVVIFGTIFGLVEEVLWYAADPGIRRTMYSSLYADLASTLPVYLIFYGVIYFLAKRKITTSRKAFLYGGIFGYIFYFIAESGLLRFRFGGIPGAPILLLLIWEINNFFLNGLLVWFPLYVSDLLSDREQT